MGETTRQIRLVIFLSVTLGSLLIMSVKPLRSGVEFLLTPLESLLTMSPQEPAENPQLMAENTQLKERLEELNIEAERSTEDGVLAEVVGFSRDSYRREIIISRGEVHGVRTGDPVLAQDSLVGVVSHVEPRRATVQLVSDPLFRTVARTENNVEGLIMGEFGALVMSRIPNGSPVESGQAVFTTGGSGSLPAGLFIGLIRSVEDDGGLLLTAFIEPLVQPADLRAVSVVVE